MKVAAPPPHGILAVVEGSAEFPHSLVGSSVRGRYRLESVLHSTADSTIFRALHLQSGRPVAVNMLAPGVSDGARGAFERSAAIIQDLEHAQIPRVRDRGENEDGLQYVVSELLPGVRLDELPRPLELSESVKLMAQILEGLSYLHARDVVHANLCPRNLFVTTEGADKGQLKILDFGGALTGMVPRLLTVSGLSVGTPGYMAPEQIAGGECDFRVDLYAAGVILYELLSGSPAWPTEDPDATLEYQLTHSVPALPERLATFESFLQRLSARDPTDRFSSAAAALDALEACVLGRERTRESSAKIAQHLAPPQDDSEPKRRRGRPPLGPWIAAAALLAGVAVLWTVVRLSDSGDPAPATSIAPAETAPVPVVREASAAPEPEREAAEAIAPAEALDDPPEPSQPPPPAPPPSTTTVPAEEAAAVSSNAKTPTKPRRPKRNASSARSDRKSADPADDPEPGPAVAAESATPAGATPVEPTPVAEPVASADTPPPTSDTPSTLLKPKRKRGPSASALIGVE